MFCSKCGNPVGEGDRFCLNCGAPVAGSTPDPQPVMPSTSLEPKLKMGWFKFLIYFGLWAGAVLNLFNAIQLFTGSHYGDKATIELVYLVFPDLKGLDVGIGFAMVALVALGLITRFRLAGYHKNAPLLLATTYAANAIISIIYVFGAGSIVSFDIIADALRSTVTSVITSIVMIIINFIYFGKRKHLFVNP